jgi:hypothetical protein
VPTDTITGLPYPSNIEAPAGAASLMALVTALAGASGKATPVLRAVDAADRDARLGGTATPAGVIVAAGQKVWLKVDTTGTAATDWVTLFDGTDDTGWIDPTTAGFSAASGFSTLTGKVRRHNGFVAVSLGLVTTNAIGSGNITNTTIINVPPAYQVAGGNTGPVGGGAVNGGWTGYQQNAAIVMASTETGFLAGDTFSVLGLWMI